MIRYNFSNNTYIIYIIIHRNKTLKNASKTHFLVNHLVIERIILVIHSARKVFKVLKIATSHRI